MKGDRRFRALVRELRVNSPALLPVRVYLRSGGEYWGSCELKWKDDRPDHFVITVYRAQWWPMLETLIHEWAHAVAWREGETVQDHGPEWGVAYAQLYQEHLDD